MVTVDLRALTGSSLLAGATSGAELLARLIRKTSSCREPAVVLLDFCGIEVATASFLRESVVGFRDYCRRVRTGLYPVVSNMSPVVEEEFRDFLVGQGDAFISCRASKNQRLLGSRVIGHLDAKQHDTFLAVLKAGEADAATLASNDKSIGITAWNNRLSALVSKGLLIETKEGRHKTYKPLIQGLVYGS